MSPTFFLMGTAFGMVLSALLYYNLFCNILQLAMGNGQVSKPSFSAIVHINSITYFIDVGYFMMEHEKVFEGKNIFFAISYQIKASNWT